VQQLLDDLGASFYREVKNRVSSCDRTRQWDECIGDFNAFIELFQDHPLVPDARGLREELQSKRDFVSLADLARQKGDD
jgi:hypothetical protein